MFSSIEKSAPDGVLVNYLKNQLRHQMRCPQLPNPRVSISFCAGAMSRHDDVVIDLDRLHPVDVFRFADKNSNAGIPCAEERLVLRSLVSASI